MSEQLSREKLEEFLKSIGANCIVTQEKSKYFILECTKRGKYEVQKRIVEELGYPATVISKREVYVYRFKPEAKVQVEVNVDTVSERLIPDDRESAFEYYTPRLCIKGNTYVIKDILKKHGFRFLGWLSKSWCKTFPSISSLREYLEKSLPELAEDIVSKGVQFEYNVDEMLSSLDELRTSLEKENTKKLGLKIISYMYFKPRAELFAEIARALNEEEIANNIENLAREFDEFGDSIDMLISLRRPEHVREEVPSIPTRVYFCVTPRRFLGRETFRALVEKTKRLGLEELARYVWCRKVGESRRIGVLYDRLVQAVANDLEGNREYLEKIESSVETNLGVDRESFRSLIEKAKNIYRELIDKMKSIIYRVLS